MSLARLVKGLVVRGLSLASFARSRTGGTTGGLLLLLLFVWKPSPIASLDLQRKKIRRWWWLVLLKNEYGVVVLVLGGMREKGLI